MRRHFTMIELLVVISVIMILASMLLPALSSTRAIARKSACSSNLRQIGQALFLYSTDWNGFMPDPYYTGAYSGPLASYTNQRCDNPLMNGRLFCNKAPRGLYYCPSTPQPASLSFCWPASTTPLNYYAPTYLQTMKSVPDLGSPASHGAWMLSIPSTSTYSNYRKLEQIKDGSAIMTEMNYSTTTLNAANCCCGGVQSSGTTNINDAFGPAWTYHGRSANFLFLDSHIKAYTYTGAQFFTTDMIPK